MNRYYTLEYSSNLSAEECDTHNSKLFTYAEKKGVKVLIGLCDYRKELKLIGINLMNKEHSVNPFKYSSSDEEIVNQIEKDIKDFAETLSIKIHDVMATIDYDIFIREYFQKSGISTFTEEIVAPSTNKEYIYRGVHEYINDLKSEGQTLILTDPYFFHKSNGIKEDIYIEELTELLRKTKAKKIVCYMPCKNNDCNIYKAVQSKLSDITIEFKDYDDCHDRFWLCLENKNGFCMGTSLNGLGRKICRIDKLDLVEVETLLEALGLLNEE